MRKMSAVILAGGQGQRMGGCFKGGLQTNGKSLLECTIEKLKLLFAEIVIVLSPGQEYYSGCVKTVYDDVVGQGPLAGLKKGLENVKYESAFVVPADVPDLDMFSVETILRHFENGESDVVLAAENGRAEHLLGIYKKELYEVAQKLLAAGERRVRSLAEAASAVELVELPLSDWYRNINTKEDWYYYCRDKVMVKLVAVEKHDGDVKTDCYDKVAIECEFQIWIAGELYKQGSCSPGCEKELFMGTMFADGYDTKNIDCSDLGVSYNNESGKITMVMTEKRAKILKKPAQEQNEIIRDHTRTYALCREVLNDCQREFSCRQYVFRQTGCTHKAALFDAKGQLLTEGIDISRSNALLKAIGDYELRKIAAKPELLLLSSRINREFVRVAKMLDIRVLAGVSAPTGEAVRFAEENGITLLGFLRGSRFNVYTVNNSVIIQE